MVNEDLSSELNEEKFLEGKGVERLFSGKHLLECD